MVFSDGEVWKTEEIAREERKKHEGMRAKVCGSVRAQQKTDVISPIDGKSAIFFDILYCTVTPWNRELCGQSLGT